MEGRLPLNSQALFFSHVVLSIFQRVEGTCLFSQGCHRFFCSDGPHGYRGLAEEAWPPPCWPSWVQGG